MSKDSKIFNFHALFLWKLPEGIFTKHRNNQWILITRGLIRAAERTMVKSLGKEKGRIDM